MTPTTIAAYLLNALVVITLLALIVCALIGLMAMGHFISVNRRPWDDQPPPASWLAKQEDRE